MKEHERQKPHAFALRQKFEEEPGEPDGLPGQVGPGDVGPLEAE
jgi:hypothetical protein